MDSTLLNSKRKWLLPLIIVIVGAVIAGAFFVAGGMIGGGNMGDRSAAAEYLEEKYGKTFVVENEPNPMVKRALGDRPKFDGRAHATDDPTLTFWVGRQTDPVSDFRDDYLGKYWAKQQRESVAAFLGTVFGTVPEFNVEIYPSDKIKNLPKGNVPVYETVLTESGEEIQFNLSVVLKEKLTDTNRDKHLNNLLKVINYAKERKVGYPVVGYALEAGRFDSYSCTISKDKLMAVTTTSDLMNCFKRYSPSN